MKKKYHFHFFSNTETFCFCAILFILVDLGGKILVKSWVLLRVGANLKNPRSAIGFYIGLKKLWGKLKTSHNVNVICYSLKILSKIKCKLLKNHYSKNLISTLQKNKPKSERPLTVTIYNTA